MSREETYVTVNVDILEATKRSERAIHVRCSDNVRRWIPRKLIFGPHEKTIDQKIGQLVALKVFDWFAEREGIPLAPKKGKS